MFRCLKALTYHQNTHIESSVTWDSMSTELVTQRFQLSRLCFQVSSAPSQVWLTLWISLYVPLGPPPPGALPWAGARPPVLPTGPSHVGKKGPS